MAKQSVTAKLEVNTQLPNKGVRLEYYSDDDFKGYVDIGKATLKWTPKHGKKPAGQKSWEEFIDWLST